MTAPPRPAGARPWILAGVFTALALLLVVVLARGFGRDPHAVPFMLKGKPAPQWTLRRLDNGEAVSLSQFKGRPVVLNFWASWCGPCRTEHPTLEWGARKFGDQVVFLGVVFEDSEANARQFLQENGHSFPQLFDPASTMAVDYAVSGVPETYFIDAQGIIREKHAMPIDPQTLQQKIQAVQRPAPASGRRMPPR